MDEDAKIIDAEVVNESHSPVPKVQNSSKIPELISFFASLQYVLEGKKIARASWSPEASWGFLKNGILTIFVKGADHEWIVSETDMEASDWMVIPE